MHSLTPGRSPRTCRNQDSLERGASMVIFALLVPVLFAGVAMAVDLGRLLYEREHLSNALDAAALAGVQSLPH